MQSSGNAFNGHQALRGRIRQNRLILAVQQIDAKGSAAARLGGDA